MQSEADGSRDWLLTPSQMHRVDASAVAAGTPGIRLMERAGEAVALSARAMRPDGEIVVLSGPGNNGGDGFVAARLLRDAGYRVTVALHAARADLRGDAALAAARFAGVVVEATPAVFRRASLVVDALFGAGARLPLGTEARALTEAANASGARILAVDLPSGVDGATGEADEQAIRADETVTFVRRKPGHILLPGRLHCGRVTLADIGIAPAIVERLDVATFLNRPRLWSALLPRPRAGGHKYARGHTLVLSGGMASTGAARLGAMAALRVGSGLVSLASPPGALMVNAAHTTAIMVRRCEGLEGLRELLADPRFGVILLGPGLGIGAETVQQVDFALGSERSVVLDADALSSAADDPERLIGAIRRSGKPVVLTPHDGEFARVFPDSSGSKLDRARAAASRSGAVVLLKGADTVVAAPDGRAAICDNAPPTLATAGAGDVLSGLIAGLLAQGMPAFEAAAAAAWIHGDSARRFGAGLIAEDLPDLVPGVLADLFG